jgi:Hemerythrin HHE cation binding domain
MAKAKTDAIALLKSDHRKVEDLFEKFSKARGNDRKASIVKEICTELMVHAVIEEEIFYPALRGGIEDDTLDEAQVEHDGAKVLIAELIDSAPDASFYDAKVTVLKEEIKHHVKEEEKPSEGMFAQARSADVDLKALGDKMTARKKELQARFKADGLPTPTTRSFKGARVEVGQPVA